MNAFLSHIKPYIKDNEAFERALKTYKKRAFRFCLSRGVDYGRELDGFIKYAPVPNIRSAYFIDDGYERLTDSISFQSGGIYIQNPSSVLPALILVDFMPDNPLILDMAAAPGGKTCALSDFIGRNGLIAANELSKSRLKSLHFNLERCGAWNVRTLNSDGRKLPKYYADTFDGILLDAPCSHENSIGTNKKVLAQWSVKLVQEMAALQKQLITAAFECLKPGGTLLYSTCTFSVEENEQVIEHLINTTDAEIITLDYPYSRGVSGIDKVDPHVIRVFPHESDLEGFFIAALRRKGELTVNKAQPSKREKSVQKVIDSYFDAFPECNIREAGNDFYMESQIPLRGDFHRTGLMFAKGRKDPFLTAQAVWELGRRINASCRSELDHEKALDYLKGFDTPLTSEYSGNVHFYQTIPVGISKVVGGCYKNKLDRYFLYGKNIKW